eukprot:4466733-Pyramimonas_sp.AAC.1
MEVSRSKTPRSPTRATPAQGPDPKQQPQEPMEVRRRPPGRSGSIASKAKAFERSGYAPAPASPVAARSKRSDE